MIPAYNCAESIRHAVNSVLQQSVAVSEIVIVDDGSKDDTLQVIKELAIQQPIVKVITQANGGPGKARNTGIENASGQWIAFLDSDDRWLPDRIEKQANLIAKHPSLAWCSGAFKRVKRSNGGMIEVGRSNVSTIIDSGGTDVYNALEVITDGTQIWTGSMLIRTDVLKELDGFDTEICGSEDIDLWVRICLQNPDIGFVAKPIAHYTVAQATSVVGRNIRNLDYTKFRFYQRLKLSRENESDPQIQSMLANLLRTKINDFAMCMVRRGESRTLRKFNLELVRRGIQQIDWKFRACSLLPEWPVKMLLKLLGKN